MTAPAPIFFPNVVQTLVQHLQSDWCMAQLESVPGVDGTVPVPCVVESEVPNPRPPRLVTLFTIPNAGAQSPVLSTRRIVSSEVGDRAPVPGESAIEPARTPVACQEHVAVETPRIGASDEEHFPTL